MTDPLLFITLLLTTAFGFALGATWMYDRSRR